jgi:hypothetical protein
MLLSSPPNSISPPPRLLFHNPRIHSTLPGWLFLFPCYFSHPKATFFSPSYVSFPPFQVGFLCSHPFPYSRVGFPTCRLILSPPPTVPHHLVSAPVSAQFCKPMAQFFHHCSLLFLCPSVTATKCAVTSQLMMTCIVELPSQCGCKPGVKA